jgi:SH3-like domain-containing protein
MKFHLTSLAIATACFSLGLASVARADTVTAHCDLYRPNEPYPGVSSNCTFSQRQGYVGIQMQSGVRYEFSPTGTQPGNFVDQYGKPVYRQDDLGEAGLVFQLNDGSRLYVYWDPSGGYGSQPVPSGNRVGTLVAHGRGSQINLRSQPTINSRAVGYGLAGDQVNILECQQDTDTPGSDLNWCKVQFLVSGATGWIRSDFIIFPSDGE